MQKHLLYVKIFDNGKFYVGITNNFKKRMYQHEFDAHKNNSSLSVHRAMRKHNHRTEIWSSGIEDRYLMELLEIQTIKQLKENGIKLYNLTNGGESIIGISNLKGENSPVATSKEYYESHSVERSCFLKVCNNKNWNIKDFIEIEDVLSIFHYHKKYFYLYKSNKIRNNINDIEEYIKKLDITEYILLNDKSLELHDLVMDIYLKAYRVNNISGISNSVLQEHYLRIKDIYIYEEKFFENLINILEHFSRKFGIDSEGTSNQGVILMLSVINNMIQKFRINVNQILANSDNTIEDIINESCIVLQEHKKAIDENNNVFINELRKRCLKFNKYGRRIDSKKQWEIFNNREEALQYEYRNPLDINEDVICGINDVKKIISKDEYNFLMDYYSYGGNYTAKKYNIKEDLVRKRVSLLIKKLKKTWG